MSAAGDALPMFPASVARLRIWTDPTTAAPSARARKSRRIRGSSVMSVITVRAPIRSPPSPVSTMPASSSARPLTSTTVRGRIVPSRRRMIRSVPPASGRATSSPPSASSATASARRVGRS